MGCSSSKAAEKDEVNPKKAGKLYRDTWASDHRPLDFKTSLGEVHTLLRTDSYHAAMKKAVSFDAEGNLIKEKAFVFPQIALPEDLRLVYILGSNEEVRRKQVGRVAKEFGMTDLDVAAMVEAEIHQGTKWGLGAATSRSQQTPIPGNMVAWLVANFIQKNPNRAGFVVNGYPIRHNDAVALELAGLNFELVVVLRDGQGAPPSDEIFARVSVDRLEIVDGMGGADAVFSQLCRIAADFGALSTAPNRVNNALRSEIALLEHHVGEVGSTLAHLKDGPIAGEAHRLQRNSDAVNAIVAQLMSSAILESEVVQLERNAANVEEAIALLRGSQSTHARAGAAATDLMSTKWEGPASIGDCLQYLYSEKGIVEGLFRVPGNKTTVDTYHAAYEAGETVNLENEHDPGAVASLLKLEMKHHGFPLDAPTTQLFVSDGDVVDPTVVTQAIGAMNRARAVGLRKLICVMEKVIDNVDITKMTAQSVVLATGPTFFPGLTPKLYMPLFKTLRTPEAWSQL